MATFPSSTTTSPGAGSSSSSSKWTEREWIAFLLVNVASIASSAAGQLPPTWAAIVGTVSTVAYTLSRTIVKTRGSIGESRS